MSRRLLALTPVFVLVLLAQAPGHTGNPPSLPDEFISEYHPTIDHTLASTDVVGTSWCLYGVNTVLKCKKNGTYVTLTFNSTTQTTPHPYHIDTDYNVNLTPLNLQSGDTLVWESYVRATSGPDRGTLVMASATTNVQ